ncbi:MAG: alginate export family protein [Lentisphaerae bacterium]|jgi:hypothetical protein|nr:alginate export family protein [Lentisphaerota bacterium]
MKIKKIIITCAASCFTIFPAFAQENKDDSIFDFGGDIRIRFESKDNWPNGGTSTANDTYSDWTRYRTKIWGQAKVEDFTLFLKLGNEFKKFRKTPNNDKQKFPDELYVDNLFVEWEGDLYGAKIGRQDLQIGSGRLFADGTPGDGSRSAFFDAIILSRKFSNDSKSKVQLLGIWNHYRNELGIGRTKGGVYDMTAIKPGNPYSKMDEAAIGFYLTVRENEQIPLDFYWIWKIEDDFYSREDKYPGRNFHTAGIRAIPKFNNWLSAETEAAYQFGRVDSMEDLKSRDISAFMFYGGLTGKTSEDTIFKPRLTLATLFLSGDKDNFYGTADGSTDNGWNTVFNRMPWVSEIGLSMYEGARWSNLVHPYAELLLEPYDDHKVALTCGPMYAARKNYDAKGYHRGILAKAGYNFPLMNKAGIEFRGGMLCEFLNYGSYFEAPKSTATFLRLEITAKF